MQCFTEVMFVDPLPIQGQYKGLVQLREDNRTKTQSFWRLDGSMRAAESTPNPNRMQGTRTCQMHG
jgi:hypothetical protein